MAVGAGAVAAAVGTGLGVSAALSSHHTAVIRPTVSAHPSITTPPSVRITTTPPVAHKVHGIADGLWKGSGQATFSQVTFNLAGHETEVQRRSAGRVSFHLKVRHGRVVAGQIVLRARVSFVLRGPIVHGVFGGGTYTARYNVTGPLRDTLWRGTVVNTFPVPPFNGHSQSVSDHVHNGFRFTPKGCSHAVVTAIGARGPGGKPIHQNLALHFNYRVDTTRVPGSGPPCAPGAGPSPSPASE